MKRVMNMTRFLVLGLILVLPAAALALDAPHTGTPGYGIDCGSCHWTSGATAPPWGTIGSLPPADDTLNNRRCNACHDGSKAIVAQTHSTSTTSTKFWAPQGGWKTECITCHDPHQQRQTAAWRALSHVATGGPTTVGGYDGVNSETSVTVPLPISGNYMGYYFLPDKNYPFYYRVNEDTNGKTTFKVKGQVNATYVKTGGYAFVYGKNVKNVISYTNPGGAPVGGTVKFFTPNGTNDAADSSNRGTSVCYVCHTQADHWSTKVPLDAHNDGQDCTDCHRHMQGFSGACNACHGGTGGNTSGAPYLAGDLVGVQNTGDSITGHTPGSHQKHVAGKSISCETCHSGNGMPTEDNVITVAFSGNAAGGSYQGKALDAPYNYNAGVTVGATESCSNVYCHSSGQHADGTALQAGDYQVPDWEVQASGACKTCHATTTPDIASGSHAQHLGSAVSITCENCHTGAGDGTVYDSTSHVNKSIDVANTYSGTATPGDGSYGTCSSATGCHGSGTPTWGTDFATTDGCTRCHGTPTVGVATDAQKAPPMATDQNAAADGTDPKVGAHQTHLNGLNNYSAVIACSECHTVPASVEAAGHINDGTDGAAEVPLAGTLAVTNPNSVPGVPGYSGGQCSNVYCHDSSRFKNGWAGGSGHIPTWNDTTYLGADKVANCGMCHGNPPGGDHPAAVANECSGCHDNVNAAGDGFVSKALHANGIVEPAAGCTGCHAANNTLPGKHSVHYASATDAANHTLATNASTSGAYVFECGNCHNDTTNHMGTRDFAAVSFNTSWAPASGGTYTANTGNGNDTVDSKNNPISTDGTCANLYCHSNGLGGAPNTAAAWNGAAMTCESCHSYDASATNKMSSGSHAAHVNDGTVMANKGCQECHNATTTNGTSIADKSKHVDGQKEVAMSATYGGSFLANNCSTTYCHSDGKGGAPAVDANWGATTTDCVSCHQGATVGTSLSGKHEAHLVNAGTTIGRNLTCDQCHADTAGNNTTISTPANHVNKVKDIKVAIDNTVCNNIKCHSNGNFDGTVAYNNPNFVTGSLGCVSCHGDGATKAYPSYVDGNMGFGDSNSHNAHVATNGITCGECHATTSTAGTSIDGTTPANHVNQTVNVSFARGGNYNNPGNEQCSATYCHGSGVPTWGGTVACGDCHAANNTLPNSHGTHYGVAANGSRASDAKVNDAVTGTYVFQCGSCHNGVPHADGTKQVAMSATWGGSMDGTKTCSSVYCHSDGNGGAGAVNPEWAVTAMNCGSCHAAEPATARHTKHVDNATYNFNCSQCHAVTTTDGTTINDKFQHVDKTKDVDWGAINADGTAYVNSSTNCSNIYCHSDGKSATQPYGAPNDAVAWGTAFATTCTSCHDGATAGTSLSGKHEAHIVNAGSTIGWDLNCQKCHADTASDNATISGYANHVNKVKDIKVSVDNSACNNIKCHSDGNFDGTPVYNNPNFASDTLGCTSCHGDGATKAYPSYADGNSGTGASNSHNAHVGSSGIACGECHSDTSTAGTSIDGSNAGNHVNQEIDVAFVQGGTYNGVPNTATTETCSATYCHGASASPAWGNVGATNCASCHGASNAMPGKHGVHYATATTATSADRTPGNNSTQTAYIFTCGKCHNAVAHAGGSVSAVQAAQVAFSGGGTYTADGSSAGTDNGFSYTAGSCGTNECHQNGSGGAPNTASFTWTGTIAGNCTGCHNNNVASGAAMASGKHTDHITDGAIMTGKTCNTCHNVTVDATDRAIADKRQHVDGGKDVDIMATYDGNAGTANWDGTQCSSVYCHSDGQATPTYKTIAWSATISDCKSCHNYDVASGTIMASGSHTEHVNNASVIATNYGCQECHNSTTTDGTSITTPANHVDKTRTVSMVKGGTWTEGTATCSSVYCHSDGQPAASRVYAAVPTWGNTTDLGCNACHGTGNALGRPDYANGGAGTATANSHTAHASVSADCANCHTDTTSDGTAIKAGSTLHTNTVENVNFAASFDTNAGTNSDNYNPGTKTCSAITCHGAGTPMWGGASLACDQCHLANNTLAGKHGKHYGVSTVAVTADKTPSNTSTGTTYEFSCGVCHNATPHADGNVSAIQAAQVVFDGTIALNNGPYAADTVLAGTDTGGRPWTDGTCSTTYCHSQGTSTTSPYGGAANTTARWNGAAMTCEGCHNYNAAATNKMASGDHTPHMNKNNVIANIACSACHTATTSDATTITNTANHVNKIKDVTIAGTYDSDTTPGNNWAANQCSNIYCHSTGQATPTYYTETWGAGTADCVFCHGGANGSLGNSGSGASLTASHTEHTGSFGYTCNVCHETVAQNNTTILGAGLSKHVDKNRQVAVTATYGGTGTEGGDLSGGSCATTNCHGTASPVWATGATTGNCSACHGMAASAADGRDTAGNVDPAVRPLGVHVAHLTAASNYSSPIACGECHKTTVDNIAGQATYVNKVNAAGHIDSSSPAELSWGALATSGGSVPGWNAGSGTCSTNYCHGDKQTGGTNKSPLWNATAYLNGVPGAAECGVCHGAPPQTASHEKAPGPVYYTLTECNGCHDHFRADATGFSDATKHINGSVDGGGCGGCHSYDVDYSGGGGYAAGVWTGGSWGKGAYRDGLTPGEGWGAHAKHINHIKTRLGYDTTTKIFAEAPFGAGDAAIICGTCHTNTGAHDTGGNTTGRLINFGDATYKYGGASGVSFLFDPAAPGTNPPTYNGASGESSATRLKSCSNVSCHYSATPVWSAY